MILSRQHAALATVGLAAVFIAVWLGASELAFGTGRYYIGVLASALLATCLLALSYIDFHSLRLPDGLTLPLIIVGLVYAIFCPDTPIISAALGATIGYGIIAALALFYRRFRGLDAIGMGDAKLLAAGGAWCGAVSVPTILLVASGAGLLVGGVVHLTATKTRERTDALRLPFGPWIALGIWTSWCWDLPASVLGL